MRTRRQNRPTKLFSFSGIDGAGKSTQIQSLCAQMEKMGLRIEVIQFWDHVAVFKRFREAAAHTLFKSEKGIGTPAAPVNRHDKNVRSWCMSGVRLCLYFGDAVSTFLVVKKALHSGKDAIVFDRYIYDELANLNLRNPVMRTYARWMKKLVPTPDVSFLLDAEPVQARARKPEYPLEFLTTCRASYLELSKLIGGVTVIPPLPIGDAEHEVLRHALSALSSPVAALAMPENIKIGPGELPV